MSLFLLEWWTFDILSKQDELRLHIMYRKKPFSRHEHSMQCKRAPSHCPLKHMWYNPPPPVHWTPWEPEGADRLGSKSQTGIVFPHLSFLPMNEALSAEEWDPYLPFGIAHVVTNQKQMSRQLALCADCVPVWEWLTDWLTVWVCVGLRWVLPLSYGTWLGLKTVTWFMSMWSEHTDVKHALWAT